MNKFNRSAPLTYRGCIIHRNTQPGYALPYTALTRDGQVAADTLAGIKQLIRRCAR